MSFYIVQFNSHRCDSPADSGGPLRLVKVQGVVQIHTGQNCEDIGLQRSNQHFKTGQTNQRNKWQQRSSHGEATGAGNHHGKTGENF